VNPPDWLSLIATPKLIERSLKVNVLRVSVRPSGILGIVNRVSHPGETRIVSILHDGTTVCGCEAGRFNRICVHLLATIIAAYNLSPTRSVEIVKRIVQKDDLPMKQSFIETDLNNFNSLVGGVPIGALVGIFGMPATNKSMLSQQLAYTFFGLGANALLVDTEGGTAAHGLPKWLSTLNKRYGLNVQVCDVNYDYKKNTFVLDPVDPKTPAFFVVDLRLITKILAFHGVKTHIEFSDPKLMKDKKTGEVVDEEGGGRMSIRCTGYEDDITRTPVGQLISKYNIRYIVYDSVTAPLELFVSGQLNFPGRDDAQGLWFQQIQEVAQVYKSTIVGIFHASRDPTNQYDPYGHPMGGKAVGHNFKFLLLIQRFQGARGAPFSLKPEKINLRKILNFRHPAKQPFGERYSIELTDTGFIDAKYEPSEDAQ